MSTTMTGIQSLARGILDSGAKVLTSYPGGPVSGVVEEAIRGAGEERPLRGVVGQREGGL